MVSDNGHLVFTTGDSKEIRFQPSSSGRVKIGDEDLTELLSQVSSGVHLSMGANQRKQGPVALNTKLFK